MICGLLLFLQVGSAVVLAADPAQHWAFRPLGNPQPPAVKNEAWCRTEIDRFILAKLEAAGVAPAPPADSRTLLRRLSLDLTGLPPGAEEIEAFTRDPQPGVAGKVDELLGSPRHGEKWARHWLDLARYSDSKGYVYGREERMFVHAHAYRDWVIRAFNEDMPYDRFLQLQIAADQLVPATAPDLAAMGFITGGRRFIGVTHDIIDDRIDVVMRGTMALTVQCARCHDHKFDPIPTADYYSLYGVFHNSGERLVNLGDTISDPEFLKRQKKLTDTMQQRRDEAAARLRTRVGDYLAAQLSLGEYPEEGFDQILEPGDIIPASVRRWRDFLHQTRETVHPIFAPWHALARLADPEFEAQAGAALDELRAKHGAKIHAAVLAAFAPPPKAMREVAERYGKVFALAESPGGEALREFLHDPKSPTTIPDVPIIENELFFPTNPTEELWKLQGDVDRWLIQTAAAPAHALTLVDREPEPSPRVFKRGSPAKPAEEVPRQFLAIVAGPERRPFQKGSGRLELAQAITRAENPLTARVMVNRIWQYHFGTGLVRTASDFGVRAEPPSHPELLDWLARRFIESGWSVKAMHRLICGSAVYQQASGAQSASYTAFPRQRLSFEQLRDAMLAASGELDTAMGGKPVAVLATENKRRTVYSLVDRQFLPGVFRTFDFANPDLHVATRSETTVPQQALFFLNDAFAAARAKALVALPEIAGAPDDAGRAAQLFRRILQREPAVEEKQTALRFIAEATAAQLPEPAKPKETPWRYGWGDYDEAAKRTKTFAPLAHFTGEAWQGAAQWPGGETAWAQLTAAGGHPGNVRAHACIRRWTAPRDATVAIAGTLTHEPEPGDGIRAFIVSSRHGELARAAVHRSKAELAITAVEVKAGDTLDFIVDIGGTLSYDQFLWSPVISIADVKWNAHADFAGPPPAALATLKPWEQLAQVLLLSNEFAFVD